MTASIPAAERQPGKLRIGMYWASSCGGCDISLLEIAEHLLELIEVADVVLWPCVADFKYRTVADYPDGYIDVCLFNGGIRSSEQEEIARLLRRKSRTLAAYGACAMDGGIPALANLKSPGEIYDAVYHSNPTLQNPGKTEPVERWSTPYGDVTLPRLYPQVLRLADIVHVDYQIPGCPPVGTQVWKVLQAVVAGEVPARADAVRVGCDTRSVCDECHLEKRKTRVKEFKRPHLAIPEPNWCLLEQGFVCLGAATRSGCGALCTKAAITCRGCYGASGLAGDQGTAMLSALGSVIDATTEDRAREIVDGIADPTGTFYRFSLASSTLKARR
jgi:F420-non-reducing hydrogenase small subunit